MSLVYLQTLLLALIQGVSVFIPVSSSAHLILFSYIIDSYIHYYTYERSTEVGKNFKKLLEIYEREDGMS